MVNRLFERRKQFETERKKKRKILYASLSACCICLFAAVGFGMWKNGMLPQNTMVDIHSDKAGVEKEGDSFAGNITQDNKEAQLKDNKNETGNKMEGHTDIAVDCAFRPWHGKNVTEELYAVLENAAEDDILSIVISPAINSAFIYRGKSIGQYESEAEQNQILCLKLKMLQKEGEDLKHGTDLYLKGTPDGIKWAKALYEERVSFYGEKLLNRYIVNGKFLLEQLQKDIENFDTNSSENAYREAIKAYRLSIVNDLQGDVALNKERLDQGYGIIVQWKKSDFLHFSAEDISQWYFDVDFKDEARDNSAKPRVAATY